MVTFDPICNAGCVLFRRGEHGQLSDPVAVPAAAAARPRQQAAHLLDQWGRRVQAAAGRAGGQVVGRSQEQAQHELRQAEPSPALLLRQGTHLPTALLSLMISE